VMFMNSPLAWWVGGAGTIRDAVGDTTRWNKSDPAEINRRTCVCAYRISWPIKLRGNQETKARLQASADRDIYTPTS